MGIAFGVCVIEGGSRGLMVLRMPPVGRAPTLTVGVKVSVRSLLRRDSRIVGLVQSRGTESRHVRLEEQS